MAQVVIVSKAGNAPPAGVDEVLGSVAKLNPGAVVVRSDSVVSVQEEAAIRGKNVLVVEDGPTLTHGDMTYGAAHVAARSFGAAQIVDPRPYAVGSIKETFARYPHLTDVLPAMGYSPRQVQELQATIDAVPCDLVLVGTPLDLGRLIRTAHPMVRVTYSLDADSTRALDGILEKFLSRS